MTAPTTSPDPNPAHDPDPQPDPLADLRKQVEAAHAMAREARELAERSAARVASTPRPALGGRFDPDPRDQLQSAARIAARTGDRKALLDYLELKRASA